MQISVKQLKRLVREALEDEFGEVEVGDIVDVIGGEVDFQGVRVLKLVDDVERETGVAHSPSDPHDRGFKGPGFVGKTEEGDELVFPLSQVAPDSKLKGYFPKLGDEFDEDEWGRPTNNPYRKSAKRLARWAVARPGDYGT